MMRLRLPPAGLLLHAGIYTAAVLAANYTAAVLVNVSVFGLVSISTLLFGITFTQRDRVHRYGRRAVYAMILVAALLNVLMSAWLDVPLRIIAASFTAIVLAEAADTEVYQRFISRPWLERVARSNAVSIPLDSVLFTTLAFAGTIDLATYVSIIVLDIVIKTVVGLVTALWRAGEDAPTASAPERAR